MKMQMILNELLVRLGCEPTEDTQLTLRLDDRRDVTLAVDEERDEVVLSIVMEKLNRQLLCQSMPLNRQLMSMTFLGAKSFGSALGWSDETECLVLWRRLANDFASVDELEHRLEEIMYVADKMEALADDVAQLQPLPQAGAAATPSPVAMPFGWLMV